MLLTYKKSYYKECLIQLGFKLISSKMVIVIFSYAQRRK